MWKFFLRMTFLLCRHLYLLAWSLGAVFCWPVFFHNLWSIKLHCELWENESSTS